MQQTQQIKLNSPKMYMMLWALVVLIFYVAVLPSFYLLVWAVAGTETVGVLDIHRSSLHWFGKVLVDHEWQASILYSTTVAIVTSGLGCVLLVTHCYFMRYARPLFDRLAYGAVLLIILIPSVNYALALRAIGGRLGLSEALILAAGHLITVIPLQFFILESRQEAVPSSLLFAGNTLGASHAINLIYVYLPLMKEAIIYSFALGFFASFDELVLATFVLDSPLITVPRRLWSQVDRSMDPSPAVISCLLLLSVVVVVGIARLSSLMKKVFRAYRV